MRALIPLTLPIAALTNPPLPAQDFELRVNRAIEKGVEFLVGRQQPDGTFKAGHTKEWPEGTAALVMLALVKSGVQPSDPVIRKTVEFLEDKPYRRTYDTAVRILAWEAVLNAKLNWKPEIQRGVDSLVSTFDADAGGWAYPHGNVDLSNTQFAVLGLWTAARIGIETHYGLWFHLTRGVLKQQRPDGGFGYRPGDDSTGSMTTAAVAVLEIAKSELDKKRLPRDFDKGLEQAWRYLEHRFRPDGNPLGAGAFNKKWLAYYLYGIERVCAIGAREKLGEHDWYVEGATHLLATQNKNGAWGNVVDTCFSLLFLRRATFTGMHKGVTPEIPKVAVAAEKKPAEQPPAHVRPKSSAPFQLRWLVSGPFEDENGDPFGRDFIRESTVKPSKAGRKWKEFRADGSFVRLSTPLGPHDNAAGYAFLWLHVREKFDGAIWFDSDDGGRIVLDGKKIFERNFEQGAGRDRQCVPITLEPGTHRLLVKITNLGLHWGFYLRFAERDGQPAKHILGRTARRRPTDAEWARHDAQWRDPVELFAQLPVSKKQRLGFDTPADLDELVFHQAWSLWPPCWIESSEKGAHDGLLPHPGARGVLGVHALGGREPAQIVWKTRVPKRGEPALFVRACAEGGRGAGRSDWLLLIDVFDGTKRHHLTSRVVQSENPATADGWRRVEASLAPFAGKEVLVLVQCGAGGTREKWSWEQAFLDLIEIR